MKSKKHKNDGTGRLVLEFLVKLFQHFPKPSKRKSECLPLFSAEKKRKKQSDEGRDLSFHDDEVRKKLHTQYKNFHGCETRPRYVDLIMGLYLGFDGLDRCL